jgi:hypothetical protein
MQSNQPTHHGYAVDVKDHELYAGRIDTGPLSDDEVMAIYELYQWGFWEKVARIGRRYGFQDVYGEGRSSGWAVPQPQPEFDTIVEATYWMRDVFRPFESDVLALMAAQREDFLVELEIAVDRARREPDEAAYWAACDVVTIDD